MNILHAISRRKTNSICSHTAKKLPLKHATEGKIEEMIENVEEEAAAATVRP
jgi:hypothetical protein